MASTRRTAFLTDDFVRGLKAPTDKTQEIFWDAPDSAIAGSAGIFVPGLGLRCTAGGVKAFVLNYLSNGVQRRPKLGRFPALTVDKARRKATKWRGEIDDGRDPQGEKLTKRAKIVAEREREKAELTVRELADRFDRDYIATSVRPRTQEGYRSQIKCHVLTSKIADLPISQVTSADIVELHAAATRVAPTQANRVLAMLHRMFNLAKAWKLVPPEFVNPAKTAPRGTDDGVKRNPENPRERYPSEDEMAAIRTALDQLPLQRNADMIRLLIYTGARRSEVMSAKWNDIDLGCSPPRWNRLAIRLKGKKNHSVPLAPQAAELLLGLRNQQVAAGTFKADGYVFPSDISKSGHMTFVRKDWDRIRHNADIAGMVLHSLRHGFASTLISAGFDLPVVGRLLAHSSPTITARYAHLADTVAQKAVDKVADIFGSAKPAKTATVEKMSSRRR
jgi:integrase